MTDDAIFPELSRAARRLQFDEIELAESMIEAVDAGLDYWPAIRQVVTEAVQRRGQYDGEVKRRIDSGRIFMEAEGLVPPMTPGRLAEALEFERFDIFDALAAAGAMDAAQNAETDLSGFTRQRAARLDAVEPRSEED